MGNKMALRYKLCLICGGEEMGKWKTTGVQKPIALERSLKFFDNRLFCVLKIICLYIFSLFFNDAEGY